MRREVTSDAPPDDVLDDMRRVIGRAREGDPGALPELRRYLAEYPALVGHYGHLAAQAEAARADLAAGDDLILRECLLREAARKRQELVRPGAGPLEGLLVGRAVACWLQLYYFEAREAQAVKDGESAGQGRYRARRVEQADRMFRRALAGLATYQWLSPVCPAPAAAATKAGKSKQAKQVQQARPVKPARPARPDATESKPATPAPNRVAPFLGGTTRKKKRRRRQRDLCAAAAN